MLRTILGEKYIIIPIFCVRLTGNEWLTADLRRIKNGLHSRFGLSVLRGGNTSSNHFYTSHSYNMAHQKTAEIIMDFN